MQAISVDTHESLIEYCYTNDNNFIKNFHTEAGKDIKVCIQKEIDSLKYAVKLNTYELKDNDKTLGYFCIDIMSETENWLVSFFILPEYRTKEIKEEFWNIVKKTLNNKFTIVIYDKNLPAKKFLIKNGCKFKNSVVVMNHVALIFEYLGE